MAWDGPGGWDQLMLTSVCVLFVLPFFFSTFSSFSAGIFAAGPYGCAQGNLLKALYSCTDSTNGLDLPTLQALTAAASSMGTIDNVRNLVGSPVSVLACTLFFSRTTTPSAAASRSTLIFIRKKKELPQCSLASPIFFCPPTRCSLCLFFFLSVQLGVPRSG